MGRQRAQAVHQQRLRRGFVRRVRQHQAGRRHAAGHLQLSRAPRHARPHNRALQRDSRRPLHEQRRARVRGHAPAEGPPARRERRTREDRGLFPSRQDHPGIEEPRRGRRRLRAHRRVRAELRAGRAHPDQAPGGRAAPGGDGDEAARGARPPSRGRARGGRARARRRGAVQHGEALRIRGGVQGGAARSRAARRQRHHARLRNREAVPRRGGVPAHGRDRGHLEVQDRQADVSAHGRRLRRAGGIGGNVMGIRRASIIAAALFALAPQVFAQEPYPSRPVKIIVPFTPGSVTDIMARSVSDKLASGLGQAVVVENRPGAGGTLGSAQVAKSAPDGYTLAVVSAGYAVNPAIYDKLPYDSLKDFSGVIPLGNLPSVMFVSAGLGVKSVRDFVALAKSKPGELNYSSAGVGSASHVNAEKFRVVTGINAVHIPMKGAPEMVSETIASRTHFGFLGIAAALSAIRDGRLVGLAVSSAKRAPTLPDVPTIAEAGVPGAEFDFWIGVLAPAQTPRAIVKRLNGEFARALQSPEVRERHANLGSEPMPMSPEQFDAYMRDQLATLGGLLRAAGVKAN